MTARTVIIIGFAAIGVLVLAAVLVSHAKPRRLATVSATLAYLIRSRPARILAVLIWAWLGWHFLAR